MSSNGGFPIAMLDYRSVDQCHIIKSFDLYVETKLVDSLAARHFTESSPSLHDLVHWSMQQWLNTLPMGWHTTSHFLGTGSTSQEVMEKLHFKWNWSKNWNWDEVSNYWEVSMSVSWIFWATKLRFCSISTGLSLPFCARHSLALSTRLGTNCQNHCGDCRPSQRPSTLQWVKGRSTCCPWKNTPEKSNIATQNCHGLKRDTDMSSKPSFWYLC